jgi:hypothetical protein
MLCGFFGLVEGGNGGIDYVARTMAKNLLASLTQIIRTVHDGLIPYEDHLQPKTRHKAPMCQALGVASLPTHISQFC